MTRVALSCSSASVGYHRLRPVLQGLDLELSSGDLTCLLGPNGSGKSTLLRSLAGLLPVLGGEVQILGRSAGSWSREHLARQIAVVLTDRVDPGLLTVSELVALGRHPFTGWLGRLDNNDRHQIGQAMEEAGVDHLAHRPLAELSDGERQRALIARALAQEPRLLILDEPTAFLDLARRVEMMALLKDLARNRHRAVLLSTHDLDLALRSADRLWLITPDGSLLNGAPEDLALAGHLATAFESSSIHWDPETGLFRPHTTPQRRACVQGDGLPALWTARALTRAGFQVKEEKGEEGKAEVQVVISQRDGGPVWHTGSGNDRKEHNTIASLLTALRAFEDQKKG